MKPFLQRVAQTYYENFGAKTSDFTFVFPNRRAGVFFRHYLSQICCKPLFAPKILTISECFASAVEYQTADRLSNLFRLYKIYRRAAKKDEDFNTFAFWGEMLLADFDEVDKYLVDVHSLFSNISDLHEIDTVFERFTAEQIEIIRQFWRNFLPSAESENKKDFVATWRILLPVYEQFKQELNAENLATEGMIARKTVENLKNGKIEKWADENFVFVGFNALNPCEKTLFEELKKRGQADFYFDYEAAELCDTDNRAAQFAEENLRFFPSKFNIGNNVIPLAEKEIELLGIPSSVGQSKQIFSILNKLYPEKSSNDNEIKTAIVLPDENLLIPLLHAFPAQIQNINITMGFPLKATPVFALFEHIFDLHRRARIAENGVSFYFRNVLAIVRHEYVAEIFPRDVGMLAQKIQNENLIYIDSNLLKINDLFSIIFTLQNDNAGTFIAYLQEIIQKISPANKQLAADFLYQYQVSLNKIAEIFRTQTADIEINTATATRMIRQMTQNIAIPFEGEPLAGLQVMGVLETRALDFDNVIITSFNEGVFPKKTATNSFIPNNLRRCFALPTGEQHDAVAAYHFYRLVTRAKKLFFLYDSRNDSAGQTGEVSRFAHQLRLHYSVPIIEKTLLYNISANEKMPLSMEKTPQVMAKLFKFAEQSEESKSLSATSLNEYIDCPLRFYLKNVEKMDTPDELAELIKEDMFGTLFHATMENLYRDFEGKTLNANDFDILLKNVLAIDKAINLAFSEKYFKRKNGEKVKLEGNNILIYNVLKKYARQMLEIDKSFAPFTYLCSERKCNVVFPIFGGKTQVNLKGVIDRIDEKNGVLRILDYKTGKNQEPRTKNHDLFAQIFDSEKDNRQKYSLQTFFYGVLFENEPEAKNKILEAGIIYLREIFKNKLPDTQRFADYETEFKTFLVQKIEEIFSPEIPFSQTLNIKRCEFCSFAAVCNR